MDVAVRIDTDGSDHESPDKITFGGEAHVPNVSLSGLPLVEANLPSSVLFRGNDRRTSFLP